MIAHHALLIVSTVPDSDLAYIQKTYSHEAEIIAYAVSSLTIDDVRRIITMAYQTPNGQAYRLLVINVRTINHEAQHALLKILEEPPRTTRFILIIPSKANLLPTILSRVIEEPSVSLDTIKPASAFTTFLALDYKARLDFIADIAKRKAESDYDALYDGLVHYVSGAPAHSLSTIDHSIRFLRQKGAAKKMIWEALALSLPVGVQ